MADLEGAALVAVVGAGLVSGYEDRIDRVLPYL